MHRLELDPVAAPVVERIFAEYLAGTGLNAIAEGLTRDGILSPSAHDPARNRHRLHNGSAWAKVAVRSILTNPRYTGRGVWNRQRRDEVLLDVEDVAAGHETKMRWNDPSDWVWSKDVTHEAIVAPDEFAAVQALMARGQGERTERKQRTSTRKYLLSGLVHCALCGRRMQGSWNHEAAHYRCTYANEYARARGLDHPKAVYLRESLIVPKLDEWLGRLFHPANLDATCEALAVASETSGDKAAQAESARRRIADCDHRLAKYRAALDADADPTIIGQWIAEVRREREEAEALIADARPAAPLTKAEVKALIAGLHDLTAKLAKADPKIKAEAYAELGVKITYHPDGRLIVAQARPQSACSKDRVGGGT